MLIPVVLCGGVGSRLWPVSRRLYPKQFAELLPGGETLMQQTLKRLEGLQNTGPAIVVCHEDQRFSAAEQARRVGCSLDTILLEPEGKNTAPATAMAAQYSMRDGEDPLLLVLPADHLIRDKEVFHKAVSVGIDFARKGKLITFGVVPAHAHTGLGYIKRGATLRTSEAYAVERFVEKPDLEAAQKYVDSGEYYWNSGMFLFRASAYLKELQQYAPQIAEVVGQAYSGAVVDSEFTRIPKERFALCESESIDYALMEKTENAVVVPLETAWSDLGDWAALAGLGDADADGNVIEGKTCLLDVRNSLIHSDASRMVAAIGLEDVVIVDTQDALLVANRARTQDVKRVVASLDVTNPELTLARTRVFRPWGSYEGLTQGPGYQVKRIIVNPGGILSLQMHDKRAEHWVVVGGVAKVTQGEASFDLAEGESTYIPIRTKHRLANPGTEPLIVIEVQCGSYLGEDDIVRFEDIYGRAGAK